VRERVGGGEADEELLVREPVRRRCSVGGGLGEGEGEK